MKPPRLIYVGPHDYEVKIKKHLDLLGETDSNNTTIKLLRRQSATSMRDTLIHEALHAIFFQSGVYKSQDLDHDTEEKIIVTVAPWILQLIQDNPELIRYLTRAA